MYVCVEYENDHVKIVAVVVVFFLFYKFQN